MAFKDRGGRKKFTGTVEGEAQKLGVEVMTETTERKLRLSPDLDRRVLHFKKNSGIRTINAAYTYLVIKALEILKM